MIIKYLSRPIYNPIRNNVSVRTDPRINGKNDMQDYSCRDMQSRKILEILINYGETLRTLEESDVSIDSIDYIFLTGGMAKCFICYANVHRKGLVAICQRQIGRFRCV